MYAGWSPPSTFSNDTVKFCLSVLGNHVPNISLGHFAGLHLNQLLLHHLFMSLSIVSESTLSYLFFPSPFCSK